MKEVATIVIESYKELKTPVFDFYSTHTSITDFYTSHIIKYQEKLWWYFMTFVLSIFLFSDIGVNFWGPLTQKTILKMYVTKTIWLVNKNLYDKFSLNSQ